MADPVSHEDNKNTRIMSPPIAVRPWASFGGQGTNNLTGLDDLVHLSRMYNDCPPVQQLLTSAARRLESLAAISHHSAFFDGCGFPLKTWLDGHTASAPPANELALSPFSFPINTLISLTQYALVSCRLGLDPTQLRDQLQGVIGHSQGLFAAAAIAHTGTGWRAFYQAADLAIQTSFWVGLESHCAAPSSTLSAEEVRDCIDNGEGAPSYLLSVVGMRSKDIATIVQQLNKHANDDGLTIHLALTNGCNNCVLAGAPQGLRKVCMALRVRKAPAMLDQSRVSFPRRLPVIDVQFLPVSAPYHSPYLESVQARVVDALSNHHLTAEELAIPIYHSLDGYNLQNEKSQDLLRVLIRAVTIDHVDWPTTCRQLHGATNVLAFGPGAIGNLIHDAVQGTGVCITAVSGRSMLPDLSFLVTPGISAPTAPHWGKQYGPCLRTSALNGTSYIETKMTRLLGTPPIMVAGMTPTTCSTELVSAISQAGFHVEFACGGYHKRESMEAALRLLAATIPAYRAITCNVIYASPKSLSWQIELLHDLIQDGLPIEGLTVGAGIPSAEVVQEWIASLNLRHIWFKPGSTDAINRVLAIARQYPTFPVGLQWTGGRAGGHHSGEDFHQPIQECYGRIRQCENIVLVAGSGFGGADDTWPYLTGAWSQSLGFAAMPFDGILFGSRMMVACESKASPAVKQLIVDASGIEDDNTGAWTRCEQEPVGGIISITSEMGQPIHVLANRGMRLWHEFDRRFFSIRDTQTRLVTLQQHRKEIITRLNQDYARPWFAMTAAGQVAEMEDLTYREVLHQLCQLMYVSHQARWIHPSYLILVHNFLRLVYARFGHGFLLSDDPVELQVAFGKNYAAQADEILYPEDADLLLALFRRRGQKPVPFIPRLDADFETWFKKDSLWQSEDVEAIPGRDAQRVCIIHGPVAARHSTTPDESAGSILDRIHKAHIKLLRQQISGDESFEETPTLQMEDRSSFKLPGVQVSQDGSFWRYHVVGPALPPTKALVEHIVGRCAWACAALLSKYIIYGNTRVKNSLRDAFKLDAGDVVEVRYTQNDPCEITLYNTSHRGDSMKHVAALELCHRENGNVALTLLMTTPSGGTSRRPVLELTMELISGPMDCDLLRVSPAEYIDRVRSLYTRLWIGDVNQSLSSAGLNSEFTGDQSRITADSVKAFMSVIQQSGPARCRAWNSQGLLVPLDYTVVVAWKALTKPLLLPALDGDLAHLLHKSVSMRVVSGVRPLHIGDVVTTSSRITERTITATGQLIEVSAEIRRDSEPVVHIRSVFVLQRRPQGSSQQQFRAVDEPDMVMHVNSPVQLQVLVSRRWLHLDASTPDLLGKTLVFCLTTQTIYDSSGNPSSLQVAGSVNLLIDTTSSSCCYGAQLGRVYLEEESCRVNPVLDFLNRHAAPLVQRQALQSPGWTGDAVIPFTAPSQSGSYALVSHDTNPIHVCPLFSRYAGRSQPVVHGMHLSATVRRILEWMVGDKRRSRFSVWRASFDNIVHSGDKLRMEVQHLAMEAGQMVLQVRVLADHGGGQIMTAEATIEQAETAYVFCGQGSQVKGMGMTLYDTHKTASTVWDRAERHFESQYGFSLLKVVRENPKTLTVHFGGRRGRQIRANYLATTSGPGSDESFIPGLTVDSAFHTFSHPAGLLMSTQFAQPALAVMEMAEYTHLRRQGVVQNPALFAGHSLGEYSALGACTTFMSFEALLSLIFYRGLKMQNALPRDSNGRTAFAMMAVDPSRIRPDFNESDFIDLVKLISQETGLLLEVVNHNVRSRQYVCAGHIRALWVLGLVCDELSRSTISNPEILQESIHRHTLKARSVSNETKLARGCATIPLDGVDIPFHSMMLREHIDDYRQYLRSHLRISDLNPDEFVGRWIPNVVGKPFSVDKSYVHLVQEITGSQSLHALLEQLGKSVP